MATRYKDRITILEDAEIEELYGRPRFTHDERVHYFALTPEERAVADGHYSLASRVLFILQAGYFKAKTLFFSFEIDEVADDVKHVLQQHYPQYHDAALKSTIVKQTRHAQQRKLLELFDYHACAGCRACSTACECRSGGPNLGQTDLRFPGSGAIPGNPQSGRPGLQLFTGRCQPRAWQRARPADKPAGYPP